MPDCKSGATIMTEQDLFKVMGHQITIARTRKGISQLQLDTLCNFTPNTTKKLEQGLPPLSIIHLSIIAGKLQSSIDFKFIPEKIKKKSS